MQGFRPGRPQVKPPLVGGPPPLPGEAHGSQTKCDADVERTSNALAATAKAQLADAEEQLAWQLAEFLDLGKRFPTLPASWFRPDFLQTESPTSGLGESVMAGSFLLVQGVRRRVCVRGPGPPIAISSIFIFPLTHAQTHLDFRAHTA